MELAVSVSGLLKDFGTVKAVRGVDLEVQSGEVLALLGLNGAGKTTIVEILEGYQTAGAGKVAVLGLDPGTTAGACSSASGSSCRRRPWSSS